MKFARTVYYIAGIYGIIALLPQYFMEARNGQDYPPPITHPEYYYGFIGVAVAFQFIFLVIARNPIHYRAMMIPSVIEKFSFGIPASILFVQNRLAAPLFAAGLIDMILGLLFIAAFLKTKPKSSLN